MMIYYVLFYFNLFHYWSCQTYFMAQRTISNDTSLEKFPSETQRQAARNFIFLRKLETGNYRIWKKTVPWMSGI